MNLMASQDILWREERLYLKCLQEVAISKQKAFPKGSLRRGEVKSLGVLSTPFGDIELSVHKEYVELYIEHNTYFGKLLRNDGSVSGHCFFSTFRNIRGVGWLTSENIFFSMDAISQDACEWYEILSENYGVDFEYNFNLSGLLTADEIWIAPELRGTLAWKVLYFCTMSAVFVHQKRLYENFVFKAHPMMTSEKFKETSAADLKRQLRDLQLFYVVHLGAERLWLDHKPSNYMYAKVPDAFWGARKSIVSRRS